MKTRFFPTLLLASGILMQTSVLAGDDYSGLALPEPDTEASSSNSDNSFQDFDIYGMPRFHRRNLPVEPDQMLLTRSCEELDYAIGYLLPDTYNYKPAFYDDKYNGAAIWASTIDEYSILEWSWLYLPYSWLVGYLEEGERHEAHYQVEKMRRAKAIKNCFVN